MKFIDANWVEYSPTKWLTFDDVLMVPQYSRIKSRNDPSIDLTTRFTSTSSMSLPIIAANMDTVCEADMAIAMQKAGGYGILHRFYEGRYGEKGWATFLDQIRKIHDSGIAPAFSVGLNPKDFDVIDRVLNLTNRTQITVCVDVAHGDQEQVFQHIHKMSKGYQGHIQIIAGNVCTPAGVKLLVDAGASSIKVGVGPGSQCSTRIIAGAGCPQLSAIMQCRKALNGLRSNAALIADGGIRNSGDIVKALAAGANSVMVGRLLAGATECPGERYRKMMGIDDTYYPESDIVEEETRKLFDKHRYCKYRGQSSAEFNADLGKTNVAAEGVSSYVPCQSSVSLVLKELSAGIRSGLTYCGAKNLQELYDKSLFIEISSAGLTESHPHG